MARLIALRSIAAFSLGILIIGPGCGRNEALTPARLETFSFAPERAIQTGASSGNVFFVAANGTARGKGTKKKPWDFRTALSHPPALKPGDTVYLRNGTYYGKFNSVLMGSPGSPITVRSYPGEWARIDGYVTTTTVSGVPEGIRGTDASFRVADGSKFKEGNQITIDDEQFYVRSSENNIVVGIHGWNGTTGSSHSAGSLIVLGGNQLEINGADAIYRDFEITNSDPVRSSPLPNSQNAPHLRGEGVVHAAPRTILINLIIHDCQEGIFTNSKAVNSEIYGCVVYNNGYVAGGVANGHGIYVINDQPTKRISDCISFNNFATGIKCVSQNGDSKFIHLEGNVVFNNGSPVDSGNNLRHFGLILGANNGSAGENTVTKCFFYQPPGAVGGYIKLGFSGTNDSVVFTDNFVMGGTQALEIDRWQGLTVTGNTFYIAGVNPLIASNVFLAQYTGAPRATISWDRNSYYNGMTVSNPNAFYYNLSNAESFGEWKDKTGFDVNSSYTTGQIAGSQTFVRANRYDPDRAHVVVYNWDHAQNVKVDVSDFLNPGDAFEVRDIQNLFGSPADSGTYKKKALSLITIGGPPAVPVGSETPSDTGPEFKVFVLLRR